jgi:hypothetical protein
VPNPLRIHSITQKDAMPPKRSLATRTQLGVRISSTAMEMLALLQEHWTETAKPPPLNRLSQSEAVDACIRCCFDQEKLSLKTGKKL